MKTQQDLETVLDPIREFYYKMISTEEVAMCLAMSIEHMRDLLEIYREGLEDKQWRMDRSSEMCALATMSKLLIDRLRNDQERLSHLIIDTQKKFSSEQGGQK